ncbi:MAG: DUF4956 domain-containing protein [Clostridiales bacterium]|jgi:hypothetical protein|nr:DUF4956 domain-containing protein [Clostridiales bacterium]
MFESIFVSAAGETAFTTPALAAALGTSLALGLLISFVYMKTQTKGQPSRGFALTLVLLPAVIAVIILLVGNNVARAFSLAGAFSIIRFRSAPGEPKDITHVLFCMAVGLAAGMGFLIYAAIVGTALCAAAAVLEVSGYGKKKGAERLLKITVPEDLSFGGAFDEVFREYTLSCDVKRIKTADLGSVYELTYGVVLKDGISEKSFIDELRCRNGNMNIVLIMDAAANSAAAEF